MSGFDYGNARLRARRSRMFDRGDYAALLTAADPDRLAAMLADGPHRPEVEAAMPVARGLRRIDMAVSAHVSHELEAVHAFYDQPHRQRLTTLTARWDLRNLLAILRSLARRAGGPSLSAELVPTGRMSRGVLEELAGRSNVRDMIDLLVQWRLPTSTTARAARDARAVFERTGDPTAIEMALVRGFRQEQSAIAGRGDEDALIRHLRDDALRWDLLTAVRLRAARLAGEPIPVDVWTIAPGPSLLSLVDTDDITATVESMLHVPAAFRTALLAWSRHADPTLLSAELDEALLVSAMSGFSRDPLGMGVPVGYVSLVEAEARNLRLVARAVAGMLDPDVVEERLVVA